MKAKTLKWCWAGHLMRTTDDRWSKTVTEWIPIDCKRRLGRPNRRWKDELQGFSNDWRETAEERNTWRDLGEAFALQWDTNG